MDSNQLETYKKSDDMMIFGCMNPAYEVGKKELPKSIQRNFIKIKYDINNDFKDFFEII